MTDDDEMVGMMVHITLPAAGAMQQRIIDEKVDRSEAVSRSLLTYNQLQLLSQEGWHLYMTRIKKVRWWEFWKTEHAWIPVDLDALASLEDDPGDEMFWRTAP